METFKLVTPTIKHKEQAIAYIKEHEEYHSAIHGVGGLNRYLNNYQNWLIKLENDRSQITNQDRVPAITFFLIRTNDNKIIGMINIRLDLNEQQRNFGGHIAFGIRPRERRKGYNKINLFLGLLECQHHGLKKVMLSCDKYNLGSSKTIKALGGKLEKEYYEDRIVHSIIQVYWIDVDTSIENYQFRYQSFIKV